MSKPDELPTYHVKFTRDELVFKYPPDSLWKRLKKRLGITPKGNQFIKLTDCEIEESDDNITFTDWKDKTQYEQTP